MKDKLLGNRYNFLDMFVLWLSMILSYTYNNLSGTALIVGYLIVCFLAPFFKRGE